MMRSFWEILFLGEIHNESLAAWCFKNMLIRMLFIKQNMQYQMKKSANV